MKSPRTTRPGAGNKYFITKGTGGYSSCIKGKPTDKNCNVLANCVGYACGAYNEEHEFGYEKYHLNCNAENFIERAIASGLSVYQNPMPGGIVVWQKGATLHGDDGAGHVAICTWVNDETNPTQMKTSESGYGATAIFWTSTRNKGTGNWGQANTYKYRGTIAPEGYKPTPKPPVTPNVNRDKTKDQIEVLIDNLYVRIDGTKSAPSIGFAHKGFYNYYETKKNDGYTWYRIADKQWIASNDGWTKVYPKEIPVLKFKIGDEVIANGPLYLSSNATKANGSVKNRRTKVSRVSKGSKHPYNTTGDLGWMDESSLTKYNPTPPTPTLKFKIGDKVTITGRLYGNADGKNPGGYIKNKKTTITRTAAGHPYPYNSTGDLGWVAESSVKKR